MKKKIDLLSVKIEKELKNYGEILDKLLEKQSKTSHVNVGIFNSACKLAVKKWKFEKEGKIC